MKLVARSLVFALSLSTVILYGQMVQCTKSGAPVFPIREGHITANKFQHIIVIVQENRTPDNLFQGLSGYPQKYDILPHGLAAVGGKLVCKVPQARSMLKAKPVDCKVVGGTQTPRCLWPEPLKNDYDPDHSHCSFELMYNNGAMNGANLVPDHCGKGPTKCTHRGKGQLLSYKYVPNTDNILSPYLEIARKYGWANCMFQTNQGPSYPAHQYLFAGTSEPNDPPNADAQGIFITENPTAHCSCYNAITDTGCLAPAGELNRTISPTTAPHEEKLANSGGTFCFKHTTLAKLLDDRVVSGNPDPVSWKYYTLEISDNPYPGGVPNTLGYNRRGSIWTAPNSIYDICLPDSNFANCTGSKWNQNVVLGPFNILHDINNCKLPGVSWVIPTGQDSDHALVTEGTGPSWVKSIVNAIQGNKCGMGYWHDTAIIITWDDWGGWYDHEPPVILSSAPQGDYEYGFRVPLLVVSAYTPRSIDEETIPNYVVHDFGSILRFIEGNFNLGEGALQFADSRTAYGKLNPSASDDLHEFFDNKFRPPQHIAGPLGPEFFLNDKRPPVSPDDD